MFHLSKKVIAITGAASGIGRELARQCAAQGAYLALNDWNVDALQALTKELVSTTNVQVLSQAYDASDRNAAANFLSSVIARFGRVDILINNAGITLLPQHAQNVSQEDIERVFRVNVWSVVHHSQLYLPYLEQTAGVLVNVSSLFGLIGYAYQAPYAMTKFAVRGFTETLRQEYANSPITISCVHPGGIKTNLINNIRGGNPIIQKHLAGLFAKGAPTTAEQAAVKIIKGIRKRKRRILVGPDARFLDFMSRLFPRFYQRFLPKAFDPKRFLRSRRIKEERKETIEAQA